MLKYLRELYLRFIEFGLGSEDVIYAHVDTHPHTDLHGRARLYQGAHTPGAACDPSTALSLS